MKEKIKKYIFWIICFVVIATTFYILSPKYYFNGSIRCNTITGACDEVSGRRWKSVIK